MAKYLVTEHPGFPSPAGFVRPGGTVTLLDSATPSRTFIPLDQPAHDALTLAKEAYVEDLERRLAELDPPRKLAPKKKKQLLFVPPIPAPAKAAEATQPEDEGQSLAEVARAAERDGSEPPVGKKRAADSK